MNAAHYVRRRTVQRSMRRSTSSGVMRTPGSGRMLFALPGILLLLALSISPILTLIRMSLSEVSAGTLNSDWNFVGIANYIAVLTGPDIAGATLHTLGFVAIVTAVGVVGGLGVAIVLRSSRPASAILLAVMVFTWALPPVVNGSVWKFLLADKGLVNQIITGFGGGSVPFLFDQKLALLSVALVNSWAVIPFNALVFRAALLAIDPEVLEAAAIDGVTRFQEIRYVLVPSARATAVVLAILTVVYAFRSFDFIYVMTTGGPGNATTTLPYLSYAQAFVERDYGLGSATGVLSLIVVVVLAVVYVRSTRRERL